MAGSRRQNAASSGKVSLADLVEAGLLAAGNTVVCNSWPFGAVVTASGTFTAQWQPLPSDFVADHGTEFMKAEFDTPSAWATAVCRVMRAQQRARKTQAGRTAGGSGEGRVAVNGWTACRVRVARTDANRRVAQRLSGSDAGIIEVPLDALRRELSRRVEPASGSESDTNVDGLAQRVASGLALGCVQQRRAAAAAADLIAAHAPAVPAGRKRKSIPDMARTAKLSRVPTSEDDDEAEDEATRAQLERFRARALELQRPAAERKALRHQRRQKLRRAISAALNAWLQRRNAVGSAMPTPLGNTLIEPRGSVLVPQHVLSQPGIASLAALCTQCASSGDAPVACAACGDRYHAFCVPLQTGGTFLCPACRCCCRCLGGPQDGALLQCDACGLAMHSQCSAQEACSAGRWLCDNCVRCLECGHRMSGHPSSSLSAGGGGVRERWAYDCSVCSACAAMLERAKVCPECIATHASERMGGAMVCCDVCALWVHERCDKLLTPSVCHALAAHDDAPYVCPACMRGDTTGAVSPALALPLCLRDLPDHAITPLSDSSDPAGSPAATVEVDAEAGQVKMEPEEVAGMLLSLTRSDVRFGRERFSPAALESRFCGPADWRQCLLCGLSGDGHAAGLGRLVPLASAAAQWAHVECLAWAWGPQPEALGDTAHPGSVRFTGELQPSTDCALCERPGASVHCCAPVPCTSAYHLPCLLTDQSPYSAAWRRALCPLHAAFSAMLPVGSVGASAYHAVRVSAELHNLPLADPGPLVRMTGNLLEYPAMEDVGGRRFLRLFAVDGVRYSVVVVRDALVGGWRVGVARGAWGEVEPVMHADAGLASAVGRALAEVLSAESPRARFVAALAAVAPRRFLGLPRDYEPDAEEEPDLSNADH